MHNLSVLTESSFTDPMDYAIHDVAIASRYARELKALFDLHLDKKLRAANPQAGARFWTLIHELDSATHRAEARLNRVRSTVIHRDNV